MWEGVTDIFSQITLIDIIDIALVAFLFYRMTLLIRGTRAIQLLKGLLVLLVAMVISDRLELRSINWLLTQIMTIGIVAIPIVFQPELRRALEQLGRGKFFGEGIFSSNQGDEREATIKEVKKSIKVLQTRKIGALIVIERETGLNDIVETGIKINGEISAELLINIFMPLSPLHDGALVINNNLIKAGGCYLPLTEKPNLGKELGTRHRAAIGITENSDAISLIVSEETGAISLAENGKLSRYLDEDELESFLIKLWGGNEERSKSFWHWRLGN
ncbi:diadenylate cyclase CdaA [Natranaerobius trueperi]|uniref:Diadenylate cyclase n=1 Tax=Natranaerobius trueperi TaxID=759412 RepID=A0A226BZH4_9FIRM|nr:diadenylate cyclase CdaA [Natranaerobius trueperi]OWZ84448.1 TIGR00159 family protein [Natranaerobius trueperi]